MSHWRYCLYCKTNLRFNQSKCALKPSWLNWSKCQNKDQRTVFTQKTSLMFVQCQRQVSAPFWKLYGLSGHLSNYPILGFGEGWTGETLHSAFQLHLCCHRYILCLSHSIMTLPSSTTGLWITFIYKFLSPTL